MELDTGLQDLFHWVKIIVFVFPDSGETMAFVMRLDSLELTNFHQFEHFAVDFDESLTVLVGENGSGKSSVLDAACVAISQLCRKLGGAGWRGIYRSDVRVELFDFDGYSDRQEQYPVTVSAAGLVGDGDTASSIEWSCSLNSPDGSTTFDEERALLDLSSQCSRRVRNGDETLVLPVLAYYGTGRLWSKDNSSLDNRRKSFSRLDGYKGAFDARVSKDQMLSWFFKMAVQDVQRAQSLKPSGESPLYAAVRSAVESSFKAISGVSKVNVSYNLDADDLDFEYIDASGEICQMLLGNLSDGYRTTLSMFADIAYRMALLNPMLGDEVLSTPGVVLIDEVDLHLHPLWQARILGDLRRVFPHVQFIATTHAPAVISSVSSKHIRLLRGGDIAEELDGEIYGSDAGRVLITVMGAPERPLEVQEMFDRFYDLLNQEEFDAAKCLISEIESKIGSDDTELVSAATALSLEEADARYAADL